MKLSLPSPNYILCLSSYPPRECGIATFTQDLTNAFDKKFNPVIKTKICALNEQPTAIYSYGDKVIHQVAATELEHYVSLARNINDDTRIKLVNIQHEFGIFGGNWSDYLIPFLQVLEKPLITTFHSVLPQPNEHLKKIIRFIAEKSKAVVVMNKLSKRILFSDYGVPLSKAAFIPHGIPQVTYEPSAFYKQQLGLENKIVLSTFGMLSENKGIEYAIRALPPIIKKFPNIIYLIIGETHPVVRQQEGEKYRNFLIAEAERLGLKNNVKFYNKYISLEEIVRFLQATDIYLSPMLDVNQSVSGTLSYALGCGRPVISTPTLYAKHIVTEENGILVRFGSASDITKSLSRLLSDEKLIKSMGACAYESTRAMTWPNVAEAYFKLFEKTAGLKAEENKLPEIKFDHLKRLTDNFGILHFAKYAKPQKRYGYSLDDNARALMVAVMGYQNHASADLERLIAVYLNFIKFTQRRNGSFSNIVSFQKQKDKTNDEDVQGRAILALSYAASNDSLPDKLRIKAELLFKRALPQIKRLKAPRAIAFTISGLYFYLKRFPEKTDLKRQLKQLCDQLVSFYERNASSDWRWFEEHLTYSNSKLTEALYHGYDLLKKKKYLKVAQNSLRFLRSITFEPNYYSPIGQNGWYFRYRKRAYFDQQPEDAASIVQTKIAAYKITKETQHLKDALTAFRWFTGKNHLNLMVYDEVTGGCHDGLGQKSMNLNEGAESTICYLTARLNFENSEIKIKI